MEKSWLLLGDIYIQVILLAEFISQAPFQFQVHHREREMFYLTTHSTHFIYGYMTSDIWLRTILIVRKETRCRHIGYSYRLTARVLLYAPSHRQDNTYHGLCYTSCGALAGTRNSSMGRFTIMRNHDLHYISASSLSYIVACIKITKTSILNNRTLIGVQFSIPGFIIHLLTDMI